MKKAAFILTTAVLSFVVVVIINLVIFENRANIVTQGVPIEQHTRNNEALIVMDIQEGLTGTLSPNNYYTSHSEPFIATCNNIIKHFHADGKPIIYVKSEVSNALVNLFNTSLKKGSPGAEFDSRLEIRSDLTISKTRQDAFSNGILDSILNHQSVGHVYIIGLDGAHCVHGTICAALNRNYSVSLIQDATLTAQEDLREKMLHRFALKGVDIIHSNEL